GPAGGCAEGEVDDAVEDRGRGGGSLDAGGEGDLGVHFGGGQRLLPEIGGEDTLYRVQGFRDDAAELGVVHGEPAGDALKMGAVAAGGAGGVLEQRGGGGGPRHAGVGLAGPVRLGAAADPGGEVGVTGEPGREGWGGGARRFSRWREAAGRASGEMREREADGGAASGMRSSAAVPRNGASGAQGPFAPPAPAQRLTTRRSRA